jgi:uncharacterized protein with PQ loop repeat
MLTSSLLTTFITWVVNISFIFAVLPQIILNRKRQTTKGLSDLYLVSYFNGYAVNFFYVFSLNFNLAYKTRAILAVLAVGYMLWQRFYYDFDFLNLKVKVLYLGDFLLLLIAGLLILLNPLNGGHVAGWVLVGIWTFYQFPQILKIHKTKSVVGFSFLLVSLIGIGNIVELLVAFLLKLPFQTHLIALRGIFVYLIFFTQFYLYSSNKKSEKILKSKIINR